MTESLSQERPLRRAYLRILPRFLFDSRHPAPSYIVKSWLLTLLPSIAAAYLVDTLIPGTEQPYLGPPGVLTTALLVLFAPVVETLIMVPPLLLLNRLFGPVAAIGTSSLLWGVAHSLDTASWGLVAWWPFLVFSTILLVWRERSIWTAMAVVMTIHALQNAVPAILMLLAS